MGLLLVLDTLTALCASALYREGVCLAHICDNIGKGHGEHLIGQIETLLCQAGIDKTEIERIGVNTGPGSFTGMRIGVAAARSLALALGIDVIGINRFEAIHCAMCQANRPCQNQPCAVILASPQDTFCVQIFNELGQAVCPPHQTTAADIAVQLSQNTVIGSSSHETIAFERIATIFADFNVLPISSDMELGALASLAAERPSLQPIPLPFYMRPPDAKPVNSSITSHIANQSRATTAPSPNLPVVM